MQTVCLLDEPWDMIDASDEPDSVDISWYEGFRRRGPVQFANNNAGDRAASLAFRRGTMSVAVHAEMSFTRINEDSALIDRMRSSAAEHSWFEASDEELASLETISHFEFKMTTCSFQLLGADSTFDSGSHCYDNAFDRGDLMVLIDGLCWK